MRYRTIVADPPWMYDTTEFPAGVGDKFRIDSKRLPRRNIPQGYPPMQTPDIAALRVVGLAESDCRLFLWATNHHLPDAFVVLASWGFEYRQTITWSKPSGPPIGSIASQRSEFLLVAVRGAPRRLWRWESSVITATRPHVNSRKPELFLDLIERSSPGPYLELFARRNRLGWDTWGNEALEHISLGVEGQG